MAGSQHIDNEFLRKITQVTEENLSNEQFGVSELAGKLGMSRSNLLRKVKKITGLSVSQLIRQVRLRQAMGMLKSSDSTVSEISYKVGFNSTSYFIKCFHDHYGYPPGEAARIEAADVDSSGQDAPDGPHRLAAIMFTDIEGYTAVMQQDEKKAIEYRKRHRVVFESITKKYGGDILQYFGDGTLSTFNSAIEAVKCGIELQETFTEQPGIPVRIGIHSGDVIFSPDGVIGDGVNVASRIESLAVAGSVFISAKVYDEVKNQQGIKVISMGSFELKNVGKPLEVFAIANPGLVVPEKIRDTDKLKTDSEEAKAVDGNQKTRPVFLWAIVFVLALIIGYLLYTSGIFSGDSEIFSISSQTPSKKSIAVLPFRNDSNDTTNVYIINGLMEAILNNLQNIEDLRVISRTSVEKYRNTNKLIPEIGKELNVDYFVEGSGQKNGDQILLNVQLIRADNDEHLWAERYDREITDIFDLQIEVANNITKEIEVFVTPEEEERISKSPTDNLEAYDLFLKGLDLLNRPERDKLNEAIDYFLQAIEQDPEFARAYAAIAISYYFMDEAMSEKKHTEQINYYADNALLFDPQLPQSLIAKALFYMSTEEYELAIPYLEKALEYNPNFDLVYVFLVDLYVNHLPNTEKYLEYALQGIQIDIGAYDSITTSFIYLHISNAFIQNGFVKEAEKYINRSLDFHPGNLYSEYVKAFVLFAKNKDLLETKELLLAALSKDTNRLDIMQEVAKINYYLRDYPEAYQYYKKFYLLRDAYSLEIYQSEDAKIGLVLDQIGKKEVSNEFFEQFRIYAENDQSIYRDLSLAAYYSYHNDKAKAIEHLRLFSQQDSYHYWIILFLDIDPLMDNIRDLKEFRKINKVLDTRFNARHKRIEKSLREKGII